MIITFFGLKPDDKIKIHDEVFDLSFYSEGGFTWDAVYYEMPISHRKYYLNRIKQYFEEKNKKIKEEQKKAKRAKK